MRYLAMSPPALTAALAPSAKSEIAWKSFVGRSNRHARESTRAPVASLILMLWSATAVLWTTDPHTSEAHIIIVHHRGNRKNTRCYRSSAWRNSGDANSIGHQFVKLMYLLCSLCMPLQWRCRVHQPPSIKATREWGHSNNWIIVMLFKGHFFMDNVGAYMFLAQGAETVRT